MNEAIKQALEALINARGYIEAELKERINLYEGYGDLMVSRTRAEREDLAEVDAAIASLQSHLAAPSGEAVPGVEDVVRVPVNAEAVPAGVAVGLTAKPLRLLDETIQRYDLRVRIDLMAELKALREVLAYGVKGDTNG